MSTRQTPVTYTRQGKPWETSWQTLPSRFTCRKSTQSIYMHALLSPSPHWRLEHASRRMESSRRLVNASNQFHFPPKILRNYEISSLSVDAVATGHILGKPLSTQSTCQNGLREDPHQTRGRLEFECTLDCNMLVARSCHLQLSIPSRCVLTLIPIRLSDSMYVLPPCVLTRTIWVGSARLLFLGAM